MSRPSSRGGKGKKEKKKTPKQQIIELTEQNASLTEALDSLRAANEQMTLKVYQMTKKILEGVDKKQFGIKDNVDLLAVNPDLIDKMINTMIVKKQIYDQSVESRVEELEARVTKMTADIAKATKKTLAYEQGLSDLLECAAVEEVRDKVYHLQLIAGEEYHHFEAHDMMRQISARRESTTSVATDDRPASATRRSIENAIKLNLTPPPRRMGGETHIRNMNRDLRLYVMKELSLEKPSGSDWRMFASRVGLDPALIDYWKGLRLDCPMGRVFSEWSNSPEATVRILHRHLVSPQLRCTIIGKKIADFYEVD